MTTRQSTHGEQGFTLLLALGFLIAMAILAGFTASRAVSHTNRLTQSIAYDQSAIMMESARDAVANLSNAGNVSIGIGLDAATYRFLVDTGGDGQADALNLPDADPSTPAGTTNGSGVTWQALAGGTPGQSAEYVALALRGDEDDLDNDGNGTIDDAAEAGFSSYFMAVRVVQNGQLIAYRAGEDINTIGDAVCLWCDGITVNQGGAGLVNGNVAVHGSVHILSNGLPPGTLAADFSGGSSITNNYNGMDAAIDGGGRNRVPALDVVEDPADGDGNADDEHLDSTLRVREGNVRVWGASRVGQSDNLFNNQKESVTGIFIADGGGDELIFNGSEASHFNSDNGITTEYDLANNPLPFPTFDNEDGIVYLTEKYLEGFEATSYTYYQDFTDPTSTQITVTNAAVQGTNQVLIGSVELVSGGDSFYWNATDNHMIEVNPGTMADVDVNDFGIGGEYIGGTYETTEANIDAIDTATATADGDNFIWYKGSSRTLIVNGRIPVDGDFSLLSGGAAFNRVFNYQGKGTILTTDLDKSGNGGQMRVTASLLTPTGPPATFPVDNLLGLMSEGDFELGASANIDIMGGFYTMGDIRVNFQTDIVGTLVGNVFNLSGQVPEVWQVPALATAWTDEQRMIGDSDPQIRPQQVGYHEFTLNTRGF